ncbi:FAD-dependent oxidoreductase [Brenneria roseae subsp. americana]|uniref:FAD-dependent oxidoreductase n=1 Tax=Brenneria roseae subsp. americana TaxID=1508507 RepID=A0A2U1TSJ5_9GAMM|nr:FAD-dependent oxidoreductase [Brenneria roseae]PWC12369.1 FAD-dependent oxidoreductase [Brenneria roseae subsp. americana]
MNDRHYDVVVIGGGIVGHAVAYGLSQKKISVAICDGGDSDFRASRGNFGLVWVQGKGLTCPPYNELSRLASQQWPDFAQRLQTETGIDCGFRRPGGLNICLSADALAQAEQAMRQLQRGNPSFCYQVWDSATLRRHVPVIAPQVAGAIYSPHDGHANPLLTLRALSHAFIQAGGRYFPNTPVNDIERDGANFRLHTAQGEIRARRIVLAAGLENTRLGMQVGLPIPIEPVRGQVLVTERLAPLIDYPSNMLRQTQEGTVMIGDSHEHVGLNNGTRPDIQRGMAQRALTAFPALANVRIVRTWGALRIMTPDGLPVYDTSDSHPGAFAVTCHSGVTLAALHSTLLPDWILGGKLHHLFEAFNVQRFTLSPSAVS